jgi:hypothetical protein
VNKLQRRRLAAVDLATPPALFMCRSAEAAGRRRSKRVPAETFTASKADDPVTPRRPTTTRSTSPARRQIADAGLRGQIVFAGGNS